jgi:hypothetical protein
MGAGSEVLVADNLTNLNYTDSGAQPVLINGAQVKPLPVGSTGVWVPIASTIVARMGAGVTVAPDPVNPAVSYIYALGGNTGNTTTASPVASTEYIAVTQNSSSQQTVGAWAAGGNLTAARWQLVAYQQSVGATGYVYAGGGAGSSNNDAAAVPTGGLLAFSNLGSNTPNRAGYAGVAVANFLFAFAGAQGNVDTSCSQAQLSTTNPLTFSKSWSNCSSSLNVGRLFTTSVVESGFIFVLGGQTNASAASNSVESVIW